MSAAPKHKEPIVRQLANRVKAKRIERVMTLADLARRAGLSGSTIHRVEEAHKAATIVSVEKIARGLELTMSELLEDLDAKPEATPESPALQRVVELLRGREEKEIEHVERVVRVLVDGLEDLR